MGRGCRSACAHPQLSLIPLPISLTVTAPEAASWLLCAKVRSQNSGPLPWITPGWMKTSEAPRQRWGYVLSYFSPVCSLCSIPTMSPYVP